MAFSGGAITHPSIHTQTRLQAAMTVETVSARLITEESCPAWLTCAFSFHGVAAGQRHRDTYDSTATEIQREGEKGLTLPKKRVHLSSQ